METLFGGAVGFRLICDSAPIAAAKSTQRTQQEVRDTLNKVISLESASAGIRLNQLAARQTVRGVRFDSRMGKLETLKTG